MKQLSEMNEESEKKIDRARVLVDALSEEGISLAGFKAIASVLDAVEAMFNTLTQPVIIDPSMFMKAPPPDGEKSELETPAAPKRAKKDNQYL